MISCQKNKFSIPEEVSYLNCAYMGPILKEMDEIGQKMLALKLRPYLIGLSDFFKPVENLKSSFSKLINNSEPERIAIIPSVSYGIANAAKNIPIGKGQKILMVHEQFP
ncbi:MAG: aminotransferase, partial [Bacteroidetes bacterium]|nr:aminotransferase [Bacteroidota bacterium]